MTRHSLNIPGTFDGLEVSPCHAVGFANEQQLIETCEPHEAEFWTVYGHRRSGGVEAFRDFTTYCTARRYAERLLKRNPHLAHHGIYEPNGNGGHK